ncbi:hypothetical protein HMI54_012052 [Coelomomyces lativittatus]|nr:hypothetical protein HMI56_004709 [Coelomomyces lativittatus]KAJ1515191.1 hypothetical protein HMI55_003951 [Coelomomyces lativittatus]KAJ1515602.1 hypothetical protein HMI54_012052 [Coelomomyces lativittatus]
MLSSNQKNAQHRLVGFRKDKKTVDEKGYTLMTLDYLRQLCKEQKGYVTPYLNDTLYLHYKGFSKISSDIGHYSGLKSLWLECNAISELENLESLQQLRCLYLQENCLTHLTHIAQLKNLAILNISQNYIQQLPLELAELPYLSQLHASHNKLKTKDQIQVLSQCPSLSVLDLHHNQFENEDILEVFYAMKQLSVLTLNANPLIPHVHHYRKTMILRIPTLTYLEDRPVSENERKTVLAWSQGGIEAERTERERQRQEERQYHQEGFLRLAQLQAEARARREFTPEPTYPMAIQQFHDAMVAKIDIATAEEGASYQDNLSTEESERGSLSTMTTLPSHGLDWNPEFHSPNSPPIRVSQALQLDGQPLDVSFTTHPSLDTLIHQHEKETVPPLELHQQFHDLSIDPTHEKEHSHFMDLPDDDMLAHDVIEERVPQEVHSMDSKNPSRDAW